MFHSLYAVTPHVLHVYTFHITVHKRFMQDLSGFLFQQAAVKAAGGLDENRNIFAQSSEGEVTFGERIIEGTVEEGYSEGFVPSCLEKCGT